MVFFTSTIRSFANPIILGKVAEVSLVYSIGRLVFDTMAFVGDVADVLDLGGSIFSKMTDKEKEYYKNSVKFEDDNFSYSENSFSYISNYAPNSSKGFHLIPGVKRTYITNSIPITSRIFVISMH